MADNNLQKERLKILGEIGNIKQKLEAWDKSAERSARELDKLEKAKIKSAGKLLETNQKIRDEQRSSYVDAQNDIKGMASLYEPLKSSERQRIQMQLNGNDLSKVALDRSNRLATINQQIANLTGDQTLEKQILQDEYDKELPKLEKNKGISSDIIDNLKYQNELAQNYASLTDRQKEASQKHRNVLDGIQDTVSGTLETFRLLTSTVGGVLGSALIGVGSVLNKLGKTTRELGGYIGSAGVSATGLSLVFGDAVNVTKGLASELGGVADLSLQTQLNTNLMATNMGISGGEAAKLTGAFARLNGNSVETAQNLAASTKEFAKQNGVIPSQVMADVANSTQAFAEYGRDGGKNIAQAAVQAAKLGVNMDTLTSVTDSLLDFESSITKELELGAMLGRNINLNKARQLAYDGQIGAAVKETIKEMGGIAAFNKMDIFQKRAAAAAAGMTVEQFQKMASNMKNLNDDGTIQLSTFDTMKETLTGIVTGPLGNMVKGLGTATIAAGQMGFKLKDGFASMKGMKGVGGKLKGLFKGMFGKGEAAGGGIGDMIKSKSGKLFAKDSPQGKMITNMGTKVKGPDLASKITGKEGVSDKLSKTTGGKKGMNVKNMIKGAAAILILSAALFVAAKAFQEFGSVTWSAVAMGLVGLAGMAAIAMVLGKVTGQLIQGSIAIALLGLALIPFAYSMKMMADIGMGQFLTIAGGLILLSAAAAALGFALPFIAAGAAAIAILGAGLIVFGLGAMVAGEGMKAFGGASSMIAEMAPQISQMIALLGPMAMMIPVIVGLAGAFALLGLALAFLGIAGLPGLLMLTGIAALSVGIIKLASILGIGGDNAESTETGGIEDGSLSEYQTQMLQKMDMLIQATAGNRDVYIDKDKITGIVSDRSERVTKNTFGLGVA
mgnify:CR=1 FL=1